MGTHELRLARRPLIAALLFAAVVAAPSARAGRSFIPIPEIITDPNEGNTFGLLGVVLFTDDNDEIKYMFAPDIQYNETKGVYPTLRFFGYPTAERRYSIVAGKSTTRDEDYEGEFRDSFWDGRAFVEAFGIYEADSTERFYGFGNDDEDDVVVRGKTPLQRKRSLCRQTADEECESNYTGVNAGGWIKPAFYVLPHVHLSYRMRIRQMEIEEGQVDSIPGIDRLHPVTRTRGLETAVYWAHQFAVTYDSRDATDIPTRGALALAYVEGADQRLGSETSFVKFGLEWRDFIPFRESSNPILALRALADWISGDRDTPFWEQSSLGGRRTLRAYGGDRFIDFNRSLLQAELRTRVWQRRMFGVNAEFSIDPFVEAGQVFRHLSDAPLSDPHWAYGVGFRGVVRPQIVGFVDVGAGSEGLAVFTGVNYPF